MTIFPIKATFWSTEGLEIQHIFFGWGGHNSTHNRHLNLSVPNNVLSLGLWNWESDSSHSLGWLVWWRKRGQKESEAQLLTLYGLSSRESLSTEREEWNRLGVEWRSRDKGDRGRTLLVAAFPAVQQPFCSPVAVPALGSVHLQKSLLCLLKAAQLGFCCLQAKLIGKL